MSRPWIALIVGHEPTRPGADSLSGTTEFVWNSNIAARVTNRLADSKELGLVRLWRAPEGYASLPGRINETGCDAAVELHFNCSDGRGHGTEVLHWHSSRRGAMLAEVWQTMILEALGLKDRGTKPITRGDRGWQMMAKTTMPTILVEPFFGDNAADWNTAVAKQDDLVDAYVAALETTAEIITAGWKF
jgi:N-acetylmuramoyl-L-alanine amidase